ncbi:hypothetical protein SVIOM342S_07401 [Streptomyces violaceorubidus]
MPSSESLAVDFMPARSEPVPGSVIAMAHISSPVTNYGGTPEPPNWTPARAVSS